MIRVPNVHLSEDEDPSSAGTRPQ